MSSAITIGHCREMKENLSDNGAETPVKRLMFKARQSSAITIGHCREMKENLSDNGAETPVKRLMFKARQSIGVIALMIMMTFISSANAQLPPEVQKEIAQRQAKEMTLLKGAWEVESIVFLGKLQGKGDRASILTQLTFKDSFLIPNNEKSKAKITLKPTTDPKQIDLLTIDANGKEGITLQGIYKVNKDSLVLNVGIPGEFSPDNFDGTEKTVLLKLKRASKKQAPEKQNDKK